MKGKGIISICTPSGPYQVGDPPPSGYVDWHDWVAIQYKGGLRQVRGEDGKWRFPQEITND